MTGHRGNGVHNDVRAALTAHELKDEDHHADMMRFMGATEQYIKTSEENARVMFQGIADLTKLIGTTREKVAEENGKSKSNQTWVSQLVTLGAAVLGSAVAVLLMLAFHVH